MSDSGFIKVARGLRDWQWYSKRNMVAIWIELLLTAAFSDYYQDGILVKRGQVITGRKKLAEKLNISEQEIRSCLDRLKSTNEITIKTTNKYSVITIVKYDEYQGKPEWINQQINQENNQQATNKQPANNQQITTIKEEQEDKECKEEKEKNNKATAKHKFGEYRHVLLTEEQHQKLMNDYANYQELITYLDEYIEMKGYKAKNHYLAIKKWVVDAVSKRKKNKESEVLPF